MISDLQFLSFKFSNVFVLAENVILGSFWVVFWPELLKMLSILFEILTSDNKQNDASDLLLFFTEVLRNVPNWAKKLIFDSFWEVFFMLIECNLWVMPLDFANWKTLLRYISVVSFVSIAFMIGKLKVFKVFRIDSASMKWPLFRVFWVLIPRNIAWFCWNFYQR